MEPEYRYGVLGRVRIPVGSYHHLWTLVGCTIVALLVAPKPWENPTLVDVKDFVRVYSWWAGLINLVPLVLLAADDRMVDAAVAGALRAQPRQGFRKDSALRRRCNGRVRDSGISAAGPEPLGGRGIQRAPLHCRGTSRSGGWPVRPKQLPLEDHAVELRFDDQSHLSEHSLAD